MIVVDTSALMAILMNEPEAEACTTALDRDIGLAMSAATVAEALIVAGHRGVGAQMQQLIAGLPVEIVPVTASDPQQIAAAYARWGRGVHRAALNFGDCFAYTLAKQRSCPLLFVGNDFALTDLSPAAS